MGLVHHRTTAKDGGEDNICNRTPWDVLANRALVLDLSVGRRMIVADSRGISVDDAVVICSLESRIAGLQRHLLRSNLSSAHEPPAPAIAVRRSSKAQELT